MDEAPAPAPKRRRRLVVGLALLAAFAACADVAIGNFLSMNPRAQSGEGKSAARCLSSPEASACRWSGWQTWAQIEPTCPQVKCMSAVAQGTRYALHRPREDGADVVALGVDVYASMAGDLWLGVDGAPLHCVDTTRRPGPLAGLVGGDEPASSTLRSDDARCSVAVERAAARR